MSAVIVHVKYWEELDRFRFRDKSGVDNEMR